MKPVSNPRVKICCIASVEEMQMAVAYGASAVGLVSAMPSGPGPIPEEAIAEIAALIPPPIASFLLTSRQDAPSIIAQQKKCRTNTIQLCDEIGRRTYRELRDSLPGVSLVQVIHVNGPESVREAIAVSTFVDAILLDSGSPTAAVKVLGGTGRVHDWNFSKAIREAVDVPVFLAGGLRAENVPRAIAEVAPFALDVCSGVRTEGKLDETKLSLFFEAVREDQSLS